MAAPAKPPRGLEKLTAANLARLLEYVEGTPHYKTAMELIRRSPRGEILLGQLRALRRALKDPVAWAYLAHLMSRVEALVCLEELPAPLSPSNERASRELEHLLAAARIRSKEERAKGRPRFIVVAEWLEQSLAEERGKGDWIMGIARGER